MTKYHRFFFFAFKRLMHRNYKFLPQTTSRSLAMLHRLIDWRRCENRCKNVCGDKQDFTVKLYFYAMGGTQNHFLLPVLPPEV